MTAVLGARIMYLETVDLAKLGGFVGEPRDRYTRPRSAALAPIRVVIACRHVLPVNRSMVRMTESVELAITCETMLRSAPNCAPNIGRMKRRPMRISIP